jgi:adenylate cyclase
VGRVTDVARELGVRYVVEGSVRRSGKRIRVGAQLIDAGSGKHLWAQRYDSDLEDLFAIQDEVTQSIVAVLPERVQAAALERASRKTTSSLDAYDHLLRGKYCHHLETADANREAESHFDRSIQLDPLFASAYAWNCRIALMQGQYAKTEHHLERALTLNPNDPRLVVQRGINFTFLGNPEAAIPWIERAMRLDPFSAHRYYLDMVRALFMAERPHDAIALLERTARSHWEHSLWLAACHAAADDQVAAYEAGQQTLALRPNLSISAYADGRFKWKRVEDKARLCNALAQAGLPS